MNASFAKALLAIVALACLGLPATRAQAPHAPTLDSVLAEFSRVPGVTARFREEKRLALLAAPLVSEGTIAYAPPGRFVRQTTTPSASTVLIDASGLRMIRAGREERIDFQTMPLVRQFVDSFLGVMRGDKRALEAAYRVELSASADGRGWSMRLTPRDATLARVFSFVSLEGRGNELSRLVVRETNGDESSTTFFAIDASHRFSPEEAARVFRAPSP